MWLNQLNLRLAQLSLNSLIILFLLVTMYIVQEYTPIVYTWVVLVKVYGILTPNYKALEGPSILGLAEGLLNSCTITLTSETGSKMFTSYRKMLV